MTSLEIFRIVPFSFTLNGNLEFGPQAISNWLSLIWLSLQKVSLNQIMFLPYILIQLSCWFHYMTKLISYAFCSLIHKYWLQGSYFFTYLFFKYRNTDIQKKKSKWKTKAPIWTLDHYCKLIHKLVLGMSLTNYYKIRESGMSLYGNSILNWKFLMSL